MGERLTLPLLLKIVDRSSSALGAIRKKSGTRPPIATGDIVLTARAMKLMFPQIEALHLVGSRLRRKVGRDLDFVAVVDDVRNMPARNLTDLEFGGRMVNLFFATPDEVEPSILEFGLGADDIRWKKAAKAKGFRLNRFGLWKGPRRLSNRMAEIAKILGMPLKPFLVLSLENPF